MKRTWNLLGKLLFWISLPGLYVYLRHGTRSRVLVTSGSYVLVVKSWYGGGRWSLPGGGLRPNEDPAAGALRELREETGISAAPEQVRFLYKSVYRQYGLRFSYNCYRVNLMDQPPVRPRRLEIARAAWVLKTRLNQYNSGCDVREALDAS
jgi:8-oxo-dGTP pyrophosphatase MutT (NUDIX family)